MNLKAALRQKGIQFQQGNDANEIRICCLFCEERGFTKDFRFRLGINVATSKGRCFNCNWASRKAVASLAYKLKVDGIVADNSKKEEKIIEHKLPEDFEQVDFDSKDYWHKKALKYLKSRRITAEQIIEHEIGFSLIGKYAHRIVFPVYVKGKLEGIVARSMGKDEPRYLNSEGRKAIYNYPEDKFSRLSTVVVTEGIIKSLNIEAIFPGIASIAILGHTLTEYQESVLFNKQIGRLIMWPDPDYQGTSGFLDLAARFNNIKAPVSLPWPRPTKQVDELEVEDIKKMFYGSYRYSDNLASEYKMQAYRQKAEA